MPSPGSPFRLILVGLPWLLVALTPSRTVLPWILAEKMRLFFAGIWFVRSAAVTCQVGWDQVCPPGLAATVTRWLPSGLETTRSPCPSMKAALLPPGFQARSRTVVPKSIDLPLTTTWRVPSLMVSPLGTVTVWADAAAATIAALPLASPPEDGAAIAVAAVPHRVSSAAAPAVVTAAVVRRLRADIEVPPGM